MESLLENTLVAADDKIFGSPTLFCGMLQGDGRDFSLLRRRRLSADAEENVRVCGLLEISSVKCCCRHAWAGHIIRPVAAFVKRLAVRTFMLV